jgi:class 3 adenylate cyclase/ketosteroid isomerase-like protein
MPVRPQGYRVGVAAVPSPEIESVARRVLKAWGAADEAAMTNLFSPDATLRVLGFDLDEWWVGPASFHKIWQTQMEEMPNWTIEVERAEAFEDGPFGWATAFTTLVTPETKTAMRHTGVFRLEAGVWRVIQWHNSIPVSNQQIFGVALTTTLDDLVNSILDDSSGFKAAGLEGTMTLVFTDIVDSTGLAQSVGDGAWAEIIGKHEKDVERITADAGGTVVKFLGDGSMLAFDSARAAVRASVEIQRVALKGQFVLRVGIHTGEVIRTDNDLYGVTVNKAARVAASAGPGEIMVSSTTKDLIGSMDGIRLGESRLVALKGLPDTHQIVPVEWD